MKCHACRGTFAEWSWQPFGPDPNGSFAAPGYHYRGFPVIKVCDSCKKRVEEKSTVHFSYKGKPYTVHQGVIVNNISQAENTFPEKKAETQ